MKRFFIPIGPMSLPEWRSKHVCVLSLSHTSFCDCMHCGKRETGIWQSRQALWCRRYRAYYTQHLKPAHHRSLSAPIGWRMQKWIGNILMFVLFNEVCSQYQQYRELSLIGKTYSRAIQKPSEEYSSVLFRPLISFDGIVSSGYS